MSGLPSVLLVHENYLYRGGEDQSVDSDASLLRERGHEVFRWSVENAEIANWPLSRKARLLWQTTWSRPSFDKASALLRQYEPDIVHFHNTLPLISPSAIHAAHDAGYPVVMTLHNYRLMCPVGTFFRSGNVCEECHTRSLFRGVFHGCYRDSRIQTAAVATMLAFHRGKGTWRDCVDGYVALTEFMRSKVIEGGLPPERVHVRPNPVASAGEPAEPADYVLFAGRLSQEKGILTFMEALPFLDEEIKVRVAGTGPLEDTIRASSASLGARVEVLGQLSHEETLGLIRRASVLVFPSVCYEGLPISVLEAMSGGTPVVASRLGAMAEMLQDGQEGYLFTPGRARELADRVNRIMKDDARRAGMRQAARRTFQERYSIELSYAKLMEIYQRAADMARTRRTAPLD